jgi:ABC-type Zn uptake system ZnuABC Zn-binding protein ZnuA
MQPVLRTLCFLLLTLCVLHLSGVRAAPLRVVTTVAPLTDMTAHIGGEAIHLHGLVPEGVNAHTFQPTPRDVRYLAEADLVILNGLALEIPTEKLARSSGKPGVTLLKLGDNTLTRAEWLFDASFPQAQGQPNPHLWLNVAHAMTYVRLIRDQLSALDGANAVRYHRNAAAYHHRLQQLDRCIAHAIDSIPSDHRILLTYHDSWPYFAARYGMRVLGAMQPANFAEPSAREVARIIRQIRQTNVPAIFGSAVFPSPVLATIAAETGVAYVQALRDDVLPGAPATPEHSYIGMMLANVRTMVTALGGKPAILEACTPDLLAKKA